MAAVSSLASLVHEFDNLRRCSDVLINDAAEDEFLNFLKIEKKFHQELLKAAQATRLIQMELDAYLKTMEGLEAKLFHAKRLLKWERNIRKAVERERDEIKKDILIFIEVLDRKPDKLPLSCVSPCKPSSIKSQIEAKYGDVFNRDAFLNKLSRTKSDDGFEGVRMSGSWKKHRPSVHNNSLPCVGKKISRNSEYFARDQENPNSFASRRSNGRRSSIAANLKDQILHISSDLDQLCTSLKNTTLQDECVNENECSVNKEPSLESRGTRNRPSMESTNRQDENAIEKECIANKQPSLDIHVTDKHQNAINHIAKIPSVSQTDQLETDCIENGSVGINLEHNFSIKSFLRAEACIQCAKNIAIGAVGLRCQNCPACCHSQCRHLVQISCVPAPVIKEFQTSYLANYLPSTPPFVPSLVVCCVNEIENRGLHKVALYRFPASEREVKTLMNLFLHQKIIPDLASINIYVLCRCIKSFLRSIREPIIPTNLWRAFSEAAQNPDHEEAKTDVCRAINALPAPNRDTLAFLMLHFQKIAGCPEILMPIEVIARVFGEIIVGYSTPDPDKNYICTEASVQTAVMIALLKTSALFWQNLLAIHSEAGTLHSNI